MTIGAFHIRVHTLQRERRAAVVIEERRLPFVAVVAIGAECRVPFRELLPMRVLVALLALFGRGLEVHVHHRGLEVRRFVAIDAGGSAMCAQQWESRRRMIELGQFLPRLGGMARLASSRPTRSFCLLHALVELPLVRIGVTTRTAQIGPVIDRRGRLEFGGFCVTIRARHRNVLAGEKEAGLFVPS